MAGRATIAFAIAVAAAASAIVSTDVLEAGTARLFFAGDCVRD